MSYETLIWEQDGGVGRLTLNRPENLNAWTHQFGAELKDVIDVAAADESVRALLITGAGRGFSSGADLKAGFVGYDLNVRGERLYHAGDTDVIPEMDAVAGVDVALLPVSGTYVMTADEAAEAARRIAPRVAVPMHWGENIGSREDALAFAELAPVEVRIMEKVA